MVDRLLKMKLCLAVEMTMEIGCSNQVLDSNYKGKSGRRFLVSNLVSCLSLMLT